MTDIQIKTITENGDILIDMPNDNKNPCKSCGVCCTHFRVSFYQGELDTSYGTVPSHLVIPITQHLVAMKGTELGGRCISLQGEIGKDISCGIYEKRSTSCKKFPVWEEDGTPNSKCQELRVKAGLIPLKNLSLID